MYFWDVFLVYFRSTVWSNPIFSLTIQDMHGLRGGYRVTAWLDLSQMRDERYGTREAIEPDLTRIWSGLASSESDAQHILAGRIQA